MFARISSLAVPFVLGFCALSVFSAPLANAELSRRQIGNLQCNIDRLSIVSSLSQTVTDVKKVASAGASDSSVTDATTTALGGLTSAQQGIATIAKALLTGQTAPADARDQVGQGLQTAQSSLASINSTDSAVTSALSTAQSTLQKAEQAGEGVVANCK